MRVLPETPAVAEERVRLDGVELFTRSVGRGPQVIVLHGGPGADHRSVLPYFDALARGRELRYYDQRGSGRSTRHPSKELGWHHHVADLGGLQRHWQTHRATFLGHSWGGLLAMLYAVEYPGHVARLVLIAPAPATAKGRDLYHERLAARLADATIAKQREDLECSGLRERDVVAYRKRAFELALLPYFYDPANAHHVRPFIVSAQVRDAVWRSLGTYDLIDRLSEVRVPALVLHGRHDPIPIDSSQQIAAALNAPLQVFDHSGHLPFVEEPDCFVAALDDVLPKAAR